MTDLQEAFYNFDQDQDGFISLEDLRLIVTTDGEPIPDVCASLLRLIFLRAKKRDRILTVSLFSPRAQTDRGVYARGRSVLLQRLCRLQGVCRVHARRRLRNPKKIFSSCAKKKKKKKKKKKRKRRGFVVGFGDGRGITVEDVWKEALHCFVSCLSLNPMKNLIACVSQEPWMRSLNCVERCDRLHSLFHHLLRHHHRRRHRRHRSCFSSSLVCSFCPTWRNPSSCGTFHHLPPHRRLLLRLNRLQRPIRPRSFAFA